RLLVQHGWLTSPRRRLRALDTTAAHDAASSHETTPGDRGRSLFLLSCPRMIADPTPPSRAEQIRREFASAWGEIGAAWGVAPSTATVQGYFLAHGGPLTEPEIRASLGLSHRAAALALAECTEWGLIERAPVARRTGRRGPAATAYVAVGDNWEWFHRVAKARKERETDPVIPVIARCVELARIGAAGDAPDGEEDELRDLSQRLDGLLRFVHLFDRGVGVI